MQKKKNAERIYLLVLVSALLIGSCSRVLSPPTRTDIGSCTLNLPATTTTDEGAIRAMLAAEGDLVVRQEITALMQLWSAESFVADAKNTPDQPADDQFWMKKDAIRHRYVRTVFPGAPAQVRPSDLIIAINADHAVVTATTHIGNEISPAGDRWTLVRSDGCWLLESLTYNLESE